VIDPKALLADLKGQVKALEADLRLYGVKDDTTAAEPLPLTSERLVPFREI
jgi:hypothetical protein